ncbi:MAG TPA: hypothetical protein VH413_11670 [Verrucomicrobiae bacterium]|jgi:uncharacterized membrane protein|nr:hypothetical protein [Verrucomicrobiae bacterium]
MRLTFDFPIAWAVGLPLALLMLALSVAWQLRRGQTWQRVTAIAALRGVALLLLIGLAARPVWVAREKTPPANRSVVLLMDRSESMSLQDGSRSRYQQALDFTREQLLPALNEAHQPVQAMLFAHDAESADGDHLAAAAPDGKRTNLGGAIVQALANPNEPPLAVIALTDGAANENDDNNRALTSLLESGVPFIGLGFGNDLGVQTLSLRRVEAPGLVSPKAAFDVSAELEMINTQNLPDFDLLLLRDGLACQQKSVQPGRGSRMWQESFSITEDKEGAHNYEIRLVPPSVPGLKCVNTSGSAAVRVSTEKELRALYIQGALTWDYKFIGMALRDDPSIKLTGLTRTSKQSIFRQNVESSGELINGFPATIEEIAPFRIIVLSNIRPVDLTVAQQEMLARFCGELGGGVLMIGGAGTFDGSWQGSRLEQLLPVVFAARTGVEGLDRQFHLQLTDDALRNPVFQISDGKSAREAWAQLPAFTQYGRVDAAKPGAQIWAQHSSDEGPNGHRILMAAQTYGAGKSAIICIQNFWRWRLAKDSDPQQFDRFWKQLFRYLGDAGSQDISIHLADQDLHPDMDVQIILEKQPNPQNVTNSSGKFTVHVENEYKEMLATQTLDLEPGHPHDFKFHAAKAGTYTISVVNAQSVPAGTRTIEIRGVNVEFQNTARDMETLKQWASVSGGLALKVEECPNGKDLVRQIKTRIIEAQRTKSVHQPAGMNGWTLLTLLGCLGSEWILRKRWGLA